ncbi:8389_t:CDS:2 [Cetraspora pellucida]|uniref:8389_t:CDS:1 n=1 Tax=Cetraspora pellucida TaxID=1433469 RepID=A0A9N9I400_9GLOM|nr:8389_t:CDS:2 [Cetraspora pellucida]
MSPTTNNNDTALDNDSSNDIDKNYDTKIDDTFQQDINTMTLRTTTPTAKLPVTHQQELNTLIMTPVTTNDPSNENANYDTKIDDVFRKQHTKNDNDILQKQYTKNDNSVFQ